MQSELVLQPVRQPVPLSDIASIMFRHKRMLSICFLTILCLAVATAILLPPKYESSVKLLVEHERADPVISPEQNDRYQGPAEPISESELNSEMELLKTDDILRNVVLQNGLAGTNPSSVKIDKAVAQLKLKLKIDLINKSNIIGMTYRSTSPQLSAKVLNSLVAFYLEKHLDVRRSHSEYEFFDQEADFYKDQMEQVEKQLSAATVVAPDLTRDQMVNKQADLRASEAQTSAEIEETERRIASLKDLEKSTPERLVTEKRTEDNPQLLQNLKGTLLTLQLERDQLLAKYQPSYRPVQDLNKKISDTQASIDLEESKPLREETTNQNTAYEWIRTELAKSQAQLQGLLGRQKADAGILSIDDEDLRHLNANAIQQQDLQREAKTAEANYLLYSQKREEARISEELDAKKFMNVVVVQSAAVPAMHVHSGAKIILLGIVAATLLSLALALVTDFFDPRFRTVNELAASLDVPVLAAIPRHHQLNKSNPVPQHGDNNFSESRAL